MPALWTPPGFRQRTTKRDVGRVRPDPEATARLRAEGHDESLEAFWLRDCLVFTEIEAHGWHLSISHRRRYPTWDEIAEARYQLVPDDVTMVMALPPSDTYVNLHPNVFHLHQAPPNWEEPFHAA